ncbi:extracellular solute-binding protein family 1 [Paenibacillus curdlanolyticus YK9]|uniref:Extracellular solute-binding protein family 1 n=1 Tax=Paenibacillus curdlanolyticus YK9 TaxID=717606 RepID=E0IEZ1_9BACL|nr:extracellular solute-binding protein [Paenibacillus curdlanolyticus]EFM08767.1 extracellular solute-binding protein family 1 [Paenibacillus curdlanolyticus YK9]
MRNKRLSTVASFLLIIALLAGCSSNSASSGTDKGADTAASGKKKVEIALWLTPQWKGVFDATEADADYDSFFKYAADKFAKQYDKYDVKVNVQVVAGDQRDELLNVNLNGGTPPDVFFESAFAMGDYAHRGALVPLNDIVDDAAKKDIDQGYWDNVTYGKDIYFYPFSHNPGTFAYNADMLKAAGLESFVGGDNEIKTWTMDEYNQILKGLKENLPKDKYPNAYPMALYALNNQGDTWNLAYLRMFGSKFFDDQGNIAIADEKGIQAAQWLKDIYKAGYTNPGAESVSSNDANAMFQNQQLAISFTNAILFNNAKADMNAGKSPKFDIRLANIPSISGDPLTFTYVVGASVFKSSDATKTEVAKDFVKFFSSDPELVKASKNSIPVRSSVVAELKSQYPLFSAYDANAPHMFSFTGNVPGYSELRQVLYPELQAIYVGEKTPEQAMKDYQTKGNSVIQKARESSVLK